MGGKKKLNLKQIERSQERQQTQTKDGKSGGRPVADKKAAGIFPPDPKSDKVIGELKKMKVLTPYSVASRFNLRLSIAKDFLEELEQIGNIEFVSGSRSIKIYKTLD